MTSNFYVSLHYASVIMGFRHNNIGKTVLSLALVWGLASCGSKRRVVGPPRNVTEISLEELIGTDRNKKINDGVLSGDARAVIAEARTWIGTPYKYGGTTRRGVDCSALIMKSYLAGCNLKLPRTAAAQRQYSSKIKRDELLPGDLVFFTSRRKGNGVAHVGLYIGDNRIIHASSSRGVIISRLSEDYYRRHYHSAGRILKPGKSLSAPVEEVLAITPEILRADSIAEAQSAMLDMMLDHMIDSIYSSDPF